MVHEVDSNNLAFYVSQRDVTILSFCHIFTLGYCVSSFLINSLYLYNQLIHLMNFSLLLFLRVEHSSKSVPLKEKYINLIKIQINVIPSDDKLESEKSIS